MESKDAQNEDWEQLNLSTLELGKIAQFGARIDQLLACDVFRNDPEALGIVDDLLGALYALAFARQTGFVDRPKKKPIELAAVTRRATQLGKGKIRRDGKWMAGYHFNNTLYRIAATYHRSLQKVTGHRDWRVDNLVSNAKTSYKGWKNDKLGVVHSQVNFLKHEPRGAHDGRVAKIGEAESAISEILDLLERWSGVPKTGTIAAS
jgi:hypothetical protein